MTDLAFERNQVFYCCGHAWEEIVVDTSQPVKACQVICSTVLKRDGHAA